MDRKKIKGQSNALHHQLNQKNDYKMTEAIRYLRDQDLSGDQFETIRLDLLEKAFAAQKAGKPAESAFGYDYKSYIDALIAEYPPMSQAMSRYESFRLWGILVLVMLAISLAQNLAAGLLTTAPPRWQVRAFELLIFLLISGLSVILASLFSRFKLVRDADFFTKKEGNRFQDFFRTYGLALLWMLLCFALMFLFKDTVLWDLPMTSGLLIFAAVLLLYLLVRKALEKSAQSQ